MTLREEVRALQQTGTDPMAHGKLAIARKAHLILPTHRLLDAASENKMGLNKIGSTMKGIGPTYMDQTGRNGLRLGAIALPAFSERFKKLCDKHKGLRDDFGFTYEGLEAKETQFFKAI